MGEKHNILFSKEEIAKRIEELGAIITNDYKDKNLYVLSLLYIVEYFSQTFSLTSSNFF